MDTTGNPRAEELSPRSNDEQRDATLEQDPVTPLFPVRPVLERRHLSIPNSLWADCLTLFPVLAGLAAATRAERNTLVSGRFCIADQGHLLPSTEI